MSGEQDGPQAKGEKTNEERVLQYLEASGGDYERVFGSDDGQRVLRDMMVFYGMFQTTFNPNATESAYKEGQRSVVLGILEKMRWREKGRVIARLNEEFIHARRDYEYSD